MFQSIGTTLSTFFNTFVYKTRLFIRWHQYLILNLFHHHGKSGRRGVGRSRRVRNRRARQLDWCARCVDVEVRARWGLTYTRADVKLCDTSWPGQRRPVMHWLLVQSVWHFSVFNVEMSFHRLFDSLKTFIQFLQSKLICFIPNLKAQNTNKLRFNFSVV